MLGLVTQHADYDLLRITSAPAHAASSSMVASARAVIGSQLI